MPRPLSQIVLTGLMFPMAMVVYLAAYAGGDGYFEYSARYNHGAACNGVAGLAMWAFVAAFSWRIWRPSLYVTPRRLRETFAAVAVALAAGLAVGGVAYWGDDDIGTFAGSVTMPLVWLACAVVIWRETEEERARRLGKIAVDSVVCPKCGYSLTGLSEARCPECGAHYTLSELLAAQPGRELDQAR